MNSNFDMNELFVFGYSCKLFHDDETALKIENEANLIPWNGNSTLLIDRYDCRGYLFDLGPYDADMFSKTKNNDQINSEDNEIEKLCDEERYLELNKQLEENALYQEEELKRFYAEQNEYGAVDLKYSEDKIQIDQTKFGKETSDGDAFKEGKSLEAFTPSDKLQLPVGMLIPETKRLNTIIEKTASFVASKGLQMEILIKAKQSTNPQFNFLNYDHNLNQYYKHIVMLISSGKYIPNVDINDTDDEQSSDDDGDYLHPLLLKTSQKEKLTNTNNIPQFKPNIKDSPYNELIEKFSVHSTKMQRKLEESINLNKKSATKALNNSEQDEPCVLNQNLNIPDDEAKLVIEKLADYVIRNGPEFEECIRVKNDQRFNFLNTGHPYYEYYQYKLAVFKNLNSKCNMKFENNPLINVKELVSQTYELKSKSCSLSSTAIDTTFNKQINNNYDSEENSIQSDLDSDIKNERFNKEQQAKRKLKASLFLNMLNKEQSKNASIQEDTSGEKVSNKLLNTDLVNIYKSNLRMDRHQGFPDDKIEILRKSRSSSRSLESLESRKSSLVSHSKKYSTDDTIIRTDFGSSKNNYTKSNHKKRSRSKRSRTKSRNSSRSRKKGHHHSRHSRSRSHSKRRHKHKSHRSSRKNHKSRYKSRSRSRSLKSRSHSGNSSKF